VKPLPHEQIGEAIRSARNGIALVPYITAGYPDKDGFIDTLKAVAKIGHVVEVGVPFTDPMADGVTIQRASHAAIESGVSLQWILKQLSTAKDIEAPLVLMGYLNPMLAFGIDELADAAVNAGVCGFIIPDLPFEECAPIRAVFEHRGLALIQLVTPATPDDRLEHLCKIGRGFTYAVTVTGITGGGTSLPPDVTRYLDRVKSKSSLPVCAGFGIRTADDVRMLGAHADGVIVGSALVEYLEGGGKPEEFLESLLAS